MSDQEHEQRGAATDEELARAGAHGAAAVEQTLVGYTAPRVFTVLGRWLEVEIRAGHIRQLPTVFLIQQLLGPIVIHMFTRPVVETTPGIPLPAIDTLCDAFAAAFIRAVGTPDR